MMDEITRRRWEMRQHPQAFKPADALKAILQDIETGELDPDHVVIVYNVKVAEDERATGYYQAGKFSRLEALGLLTQGLHVMGERG